MSDRQDDTIEEISRPILNIDGRSDNANWLRILEDRRRKREHEPQPSPLPPLSQPPQQKEQPSNGRQ